MHDGSTIPFYTYKDQSRLQLRYWMIPEQATIAEAFIESEAIVTPEFHHSHARLNRDTTSCRNSKLVDVSNAVPQQYDGPIKAIMRWPGTGTKPGSIIIQQILMRGSEDLPTG